MDITVTDTESGAACVLEVDDEETVGSLKHKAADALGFHTAHLSHLSLRVPGTDASIGSDETELSQSALQGGGTLYLAREPARIKSPHTYITRGPQSYTERYSIGSGIKSIAVTRCGRRAAFGCSMGKVSLYDTEAAELLWEHDTNERRAVLTMAFSLTDSLLATTCAQKAQVWCVARGTLLHRLSHSNMIVEGIGFAACGTYVVTGASDAVRMWDATPPPLGHEGSVAVQCHREFGGHTSRVSRVRVTRGGKILAAGRHKDIWMWDMQHDHPAQVLQGHTAVVTDLATADCGTLAVSTSWDRTNRVWDVDSGACLRVIPSDEVTSLCVAYGPSGPCMLALTRGSSEVSAWDLQTGRAVHTSVEPKSASVIAAPLDARHVFRWNRNCEVGSERRSIAVSALELSSLVD
eukprot:TRINITY_DN2759_c0_g1_i2.p1 TRINITY_DN2759_c0_g1~~TRINITY_DN2759_c0_g1_i2.p1  ORF type:complete len:429 (+),score=94.15 TRINITY_DN2759_c0_g1_i2:64-1287(+)